MEGAHAAFGLIDQRDNGALCLQVLLVALCALRCVAGVGFVTKVRDDLGYRS
jgi:hypothetical protein